MLIWATLSQVALAHNVHHALEADPTCLLCLSQSNLSSATLNTQHSQVLIKRSSLQIVFVTIITVENRIIPFSTRDPPTIVIL